MTTIARIALPIVLGLTIVGCSKPPPAEVKEVSRPAKIFTVQKPGSAYIRSFPGEVRATDEANLAFRVAGELTKIPARRGTQVKQGELLAQIDPSDHQAALDKAQAEFDLSKAQFNRVTELLERQLVSKADYEQKLAIMRVNQSNLARAQNNLGYTGIYAPFDGVIARQLAENHESVAAGQVVLVLQTGKMIDVAIDVNESIIARFERREAQSNPRQVQVRFQSAGNTYPAYYKEHDSQANPSTLTYKVIFSLPVPDDINVLPGMSATVTADLSGLYAGGTTSLVIPIEAVFSAEDEPLDAVEKYLWWVDPDSMRTERRAVQVGQLTGDSIVVNGGIEEGDMIIAAGVHAVLEGMLVRTMEREGGL